MAETFNVLTATASELRSLFEDDKTTSLMVVEAYLAQIEKHNTQGLNLRALVSVAPREKLLALAQALDEERKAGRTRGPLHGIPFICKDVFVTHPDLGLPTTAGAPCFASAVAKRTAPAIQHLLDFGMILLGKANLTEFCGLRMKGLTPGFSAQGGQTQSPYIFGGLEKDDKLIGHSSAGGSSSGSAAGVAAGFAPLSVGTECCGSVITPANRAALYALKAGLGTVNCDGVFGYTDCLDCIGGMAKSVEDLSNFMTLLMRREMPFDLSGGWHGLKLAFLDPAVWMIGGEMCSWPGDTHEQMTSAYQRALKTIDGQGATVAYPVDLPLSNDTFKVNGKSVYYELAMYQLKTKFLPAFFDEFSQCDVNSLEAIIKYNEQHADVCLPPAYPQQEELVDLMNDDRTEAEFHHILAETRRRGGPEGIDLLFEHHDLVVALADSPLCLYSSAAGYPIACVPLSTVKYSKQNERPFGLCAVAKAGREDLLMRFMAAFEAAFPPRAVPFALVGGA